MNQKTITDLINSFVSPNNVNQNKRTCQTIENDVDRGGSQMLQTIAKKELNIDLSDLDSAVAYMWLCENKTNEMLDSLIEESGKYNEFSANPEAELIQEAIINTALNVRYPNWKPILTPAEKLISIANK